MSRLYSGRANILIFAFCICSQGCFPKQQSTRTNDESGPSEYYGASGNELLIHPKDNPWEFDLREESKLLEKTQSQILRKDTPRTLGSKQTTGADFLKEPLVLVGTIDGLSERMEEVVDSLSEHGIFYDISGSRQNAICVQKSRASDAREILERLRDQSGIHLSVAR